MNYGDRMTFTPLLSYLLYKAYIGNPKIQILIIHILMNNITNKRINIVLQLENVI